MRISEVANLCGASPKEVIEMVEAQRAVFEGRGVKINKRLTASSSLDQEVAAEIVATRDRHQQQSLAQEREAEDRRHREEAERRRVAEQRKRDALAEEERKKQEERRKAAEAELARKQEEVARQKAAEEAAAAEAARAAAEAAKAAEAARAAEAAKAASEAKARTEAPAPTPPAPAPPPVASAPPAAAAPAAPTASAPVPVPPSAPAAPRPPAGPAAGSQQRPPHGGPPRPQGNLPPMARPAGPGAERPSYRPGGSMPRDGQGAGPRPGGPTGERRYDGPPREGGRGPGAPGGERRGPGGPGGERRAPGYGPGGTGERRFDGPPREGRGPGGPGGPQRYGDRPSGPAGQRYGDRPGGGPGGQRYGDRPSGPGGPRSGPGGPGGGRYGDRPSGPGGPRTGMGPGRGPAGPGMGRGPREGGPGRPSDGRGGAPFERRGPRPGGGSTSDADSPSSLFGEENRRKKDRTKDKDRDKSSDRSLDNFLEQGIGTGLKDDFAARGRRGPAPRGATPPGKKKGPAAGDKRFRPTQIFGGDIEDARGGKRRKRHGGEAEERGAAPAAPEQKVLNLYGDFTVADFAAKLGVQPADVIKRLFLMGEILTINQTLDPDMAELLAGEFGVEVVVHREGDEHDVKEYLPAPAKPEDLRPRPPVVTVMGHVDHGKTTLLDRIRKANVAAGEAGGMTQHIGAYHVSTAKGDIVFLDTPGHEAFTSMRARGAQVTDLVVLVVAANDGVMPQTIEAINHAKAAEVPIIVAINKIDAPGANVMRVKQELMGHGLLSEEFGGETIMVPVSALTGEKMDELLELIALQSEVLELKADYKSRAVGHVVESRIDPLRGATATILISSGTLRVGDVFLSGSHWGRVRAMRDDKGKAIEEATPSVPVEILGLSGSPGAGEQFLVMPDEATARDIADRRERRRRMKGAVAKTHVTLENLAEHLAEGDTKTLNVIIKGDVQGSIEAIRGSLLKIKSNKVTIKVLHAAVGAIGEADVNLADASDAVVLGFNVRPDPAAVNLAESLGVDIRLYDIIFNLIADVEKAMVGLLEPTLEEKAEGRVRVLQVFKISKVGTIAGSIVESGTIARDHSARLVRDGVVVWQGKLASLRRVKDDVKSVNAGMECGVGLERFNDVKVGDIIETYTMFKKAATLTGES